MVLGHNYSQGDWKIFFFRRTCKTGGRNAHSPDEMQFTVHGAMKNPKLSKNSQNIKHDCRLLGFTIYCVVVTVQKYKKKIIIQKVVSFDCTSQQRWLEEWVRLDTSVLVLVATLLRTGYSVLVYGKLYKVW